MKKLPLIIMMLITAGCYSVGPGNRSLSASSSLNTVVVDNPTLTLSDYLRRVPGVQVTGSGDNARIRIRNGSFSPSGDNEPLYVINDSPVGTSYSYVNSVVDINDISKVEILKTTSETSAYGLLGANGVVRIYTKMW